MKKTLTVVAASLASATLAVGVSATAANAADRAWTCQDGGHTLTNRIYYSQDDTYHTWQKLTYKLTGSNTGGKSNWSAAFNDGTPTRKFYANKQDDLDQNVLYTEDFTNFSSKRSASEKWTASAAFDTAGTDNHCTSSTIF